MKPSFIIDNAGNFQAAAYGVSVQCFSMEEITKKCEQLDKELEAIARTRSGEQAARKKLLNFCDTAQSIADQVHKEILTRIINLRYCTEYEHLPQLTLYD